MTAILVRDVRKRYGEREILRGVSFSVARGELLALLGPNGAGKTTTVEILEGYRRADDGSVRVLGLDPRTDGSALRPRVGLMLQEGGHDPRATPRETLALHASLFADPVPPDALLGLVGLDAVASTRIRRLSGGERQRLGLALALVGRPEVLILDEPTAGLDPEAKQATRTLIAGLRDAGATILLTTHDLADVELLADRVAVLDDGRIVADGRPHELAAGGMPVLRFRTAPALSEIAGRELVDRIAAVTDGARPVPELLADGPLGRYRLNGVRPTPSLLAMVTAFCAERDVLIVELRTGSGSLEERYLELVAGAAEDAP